MKETIKKLQSYQPALLPDQVKAKYNLKRIARLSANENPYGPSPKVAAALQQFDFAELNYYPDGYATRLREQVAERLTVDPESIVFGVGLDEIIAYLSRVFLEPGDEVIVSEPTFSEYALNAQIEGAKVLTVPIDQPSGKQDLETMAQQISPRTKMIWLCNPNNPTGVYENIDDLRNFMKKVPKNVLVLIDEAYIQFVTDAQPATALPLLKEFDNLGIMRTFSKIYGLANLRVGFIVMTKRLADYVQTIRLPYNLNSLSQLAASVALDDQDFVAEVAKKNQVERDHWEDFLEQMQLKHYHSQANFVYFITDQAQEIGQKLLANGYQIREGLAPDALRISVGKQADNLAMQKIIQEILKDK